MQKLSVLCFLLFICLFVCLTSRQQLIYMETGPQLEVLSDKLVMLGIEPATPGLQG